jgi:hypothetical protein
MRGKHSTPPPPPHGRRYGWLARQLRPYGGHPKNVRIDGKVVKGYDFDELLELFRRYLPKSVIQSWIAEQTRLGEGDKQ